MIKPRYPAGFRLLRDVFSAEEATRYESDISEMSLNRVTMRGRALRLRGTVAAFAPLFDGHATGLAAFTLTADELAPKPSRRRGAWH